MENTVNFLKAEFTYIEEDLQRQWEYLEDEVQYKSLDNIEPFLTRIKKLEARKIGLKILIERALANES